MMSNLFVVCFAIPNSYIVRQDEASVNWFLQRIANIWQHTVTGVPGAGSP
jgi:hypothetical protein